MTSSVANTNHLSILSLFVVFRIRIRNGLFTAIEYRNMELGRIFENILYIIFFFDFIIFHSCSLPPLASWAFCLGPKVDPTDAHVSSCIS